MDRSAPVMGQKAPSAIRCIKTRHNAFADNDGDVVVRKHLAP